MDVPSPSPASCGISRSRSATRSPKARCSSRSNRRVRRRPRRLKRRRRQRARRPQRLLSRPGRPQRKSPAAPRSRRPNAAGFVDQSRHPRRSGRARRGPRRLHRGVPRRRPRQEDGADRALSHAGRRVPQRRLHSVQSAAAHREGDHRSRGDRARRCVLRQTEDRSREAAGMESRRRVQAHQRPRRPREAAQSRSRAGSRRVRVGEHDPGRNAAGREDGRVRSLHHRGGLVGRAHSRAFRTTTSAYSIRPARSSCPRSRSACSSSAAASSGSRWRRCTTRSAARSPWSS